MNNTITAKNYKKLVLQVGLGNMSFCSFNMLNGEISGVNTLSLPGGKPLEDSLWKAFNDHPELTEAYDEVMVLHDNSFNTFVPQALFDENYLGSYLQYNTKVFETDVFAYDAIGNYEINNVYVPLMNVNNFLIDRFGSFEYKNANSILVAKLLEATKNIDAKQVFVHVQDRHFELVIARNQKLLLYNSFEYSTPEDFLYYLLFALEQLQLNPETVKVAMLGNIDETHPCFDIAYKYIRDISLFEAMALQEKHNRGRKETLQHFILFNA